MNKLKKTRGMTNRYFLALVAITLPNETRLPAKNQMLFFEQPIKPTDDEIITTARRNYAYRYAKSIQIKSVKQIGKAEFLLLTETTTTESEGVI